MNNERKINIYRHDSYNFFDSLQSIRWKLIDLFFIYLYVLLKTRIKLVKVRLLY